MVMMSRFGLDGIESELVVHWMVQGMERAFLSLLPHSLVCRIVPGIDTGLIGGIGICGVIHHSGFFISSVLDMDSSRLISIIPCTCFILKSCFKTVFLFLVTTSKRVAPTPK
jgi:hypothetical protein